MKKFRLSLLLVAAGLLLTGCGVFVPCDGCSYPSYPYQQGYYSGYGGGDYGAPQCYDAGSGGHADCGEIANRRPLSSSFYYPGGYSRVYGPNYYSNPPSYVSPSQGAVAPPINMWVWPVYIKPETSGLTVNNYFESDLIPDRCRSKNHEVAGRCLLDLVQPLMDLQMACAAEKDPSLRPPICEKEPGEKAALYSEFGRKLMARQWEQKMAK